MDSALDLALSCASASKTGNAFLKGVPYTPVSGLDIFTVSHRALLPRYSGEGDMPAGMSRHMTRICLGMRILELSHELNQFFHPFFGHGVVYGCPKTSSASVSRQPEESVFFRFLGEFLFEFGIV